MTSRTILWTILAICAASLALAAIPDDEVVSSVSVQGMPVVEAAAKLREDLKESGLEIEIYLSPEAAMSPREGFLDAREMRLHQVVALFARAYRLDYQWRGDVLLLNVRDSGRSEQRSSAAEENAKKSITHAREFAGLFEDSFSFLLDYDGPAPKLRARHLLHRRYLLDMAVRVHFAGSGVEVTYYEEPEFLLLEVRSVSPAPDGEFDMAFGNVQKRFGLDEWKKVLEAGGDFSAIGITLRKDAPVPGIEDYWEDQRTRAID